MKRIIKKILFDSDSQIKTIRFGIAKGIKMRLSMENKSQRYFGLDEKEIQEKFKKYSEQCNVFYDIGASDGYYGLINYKFNSNGQLFLCDSNIEFLSIQKRNFKLNNFPLTNINFVHKHISDLNDENHVSLDTLMPEGIFKIFFKIDVDGGELKVLTGLKNTLLTNNCFLIIETHSHDLEIQCIKFLNDIGYRCDIIKNAWWRLFIPEQRPIPHNRWFNAEKS